MPPPQMIAAVIVLVVGIACLIGGSVLLGRARTTLTDAAEEKRAIVRRIEEAQREAETIRREAQVEARDQAQQIRETAEREAKEVRAELQRLERRVEQREETLERRLEMLESRERQLPAREQQVAQLETDARQLVQQQRDALERLAALSTDDARALLLKQVEDETRHDMARLIRQIEEQSKADADRKARELIVQCIQRCAVDHVSETTVSVVPLPSDDMKGRIIGREGRNIRAFETLTGVDVIIDDTPEAVVLSAFDPVRRETARLALSDLVMDGRIHPGRIEETIVRARAEVDRQVQEAGELAAMRAGVSGLHPEIIRQLGKLKYRTSYGQQVLDHSVEVAHLAAAMATELKLDAEVCRRGGLLHDVGKASDYESEGTHLQISVELATKYGESPDVIHAIEAHHMDVEFRTVEAALVQVADAISASRPGARREMLETYIKRLQRLERVVDSFEGVEKSYAVQAGRELRIIVRPGELDDYGSARLAREIAKKIEEEMDYPGQIKVVVIRETRSVDYAR